MTARELALAEGFRLTDRRFEVPGMDGVTVTTYVAA